MTPTGASPVEPPGPLVRVDDLGAHAGGLAWLLSARRGVATVRFLGDQRDTDVAEERVHNVRPAAPSAAGG